MTADAFRHRLAAELTAARHALADVLEEPCPIARRTIGDATLHRTQPLYRLSDGVVAHAGEAEADAGARPLTAREVLEHVEAHAAAIAEREARTLEVAAELLAHDDEERRDFVQRAPASWPWSAWIGFRGNDLLPLLVMLVADVAEARDGTPWPATPDEDVPEWAAEAIARRDEQAATSYRARAEHGFTNIELRGELVVLDQVAALYALLPAAVRDARATRRYVLRVAAGDEHRALEAIAAYVLATEKADDTSDARALLASRTGKRADAIVKAAKFAERAPPRTVTDAAELFDVLTEAFAAHVERDDKALASNARAFSAKQRRNWWRADDWLTAIARHTWKLAANELAEKRARTITGATMPVVMLLARTTQRGVSVRRDEERQLDLLLDRDHEPFARLVPESITSGLTLAALDKLRETSHLLSSVDAHALIQFLAAEAYTHHVNGGDFAVQIEGGWTELARRLGITERREGERLDSILDALRFMRGEFHGIEIGGLATHIHYPAKGRRPAVLRIIIGEALRPTFGKFLEASLGPSSPAAVEARMVVPFVGLPPFFGRGNDHALQASAALETAIILRRRAHEIADRGGVAISRVEWEGIADRAGYARRYLGRTVDALQSGWIVRPKSAPPTWKPLLEVKGGLYHFGEPHVAARAALEEAGRRTLEGRKRGEASARASAAEHRRRRRK